MVILVYVNIHKETSMGKQTRGEEEKARYVHNLHR